MSHPSVSVSVPADPRFVRIVRVVANRAAATAGLGIDRIEDLILAIDEAAGELLRSAHGPTITGELFSETDAVRVCLRTDGAVAEWPRSSWSGSLAAKVLDSVTSEVTFDDGDADHSIELLVR